MASRIITKKGSGAPLASDLVHGELAVDTVNKRLYTENAGGTIIELGTAPSTIDINAGTIDGTVIGGSSAAAGTFTSITGTSANINGTVTADGLTVENLGNTVQQSIYTSDNVSNATAKLSFGTTPGSREKARIEMTNTNTGNAAGSLTLLTNDGSTLNDRLLIESNGDISFYEDTGTTAKFFWDASAESLGIGTSSPQSFTSLQVKTATDRNFAVFDNAAGVTLGGLTDAGASAALRIAGQNVVFTGAGGSGSEHMRIDSSGNVGIGTTSPSYKLHISDTAVGSAVWANVNNTDATTAGATAGFFGSNGTVNSVLYSAGNALLGATGTTSNHPFIFLTNGSERMRIDSSGNLLVGTTALPTAANTVTGVGINPSGLISATRNGSTGGPAGIFNRTVIDGDILTFRKDGTTVGSISVTSSTTTYNITSDQRLKDNIVDAPAGNVDDIKVRSFDWKADGSHQEYGMVAQELEAVAPYAVTKGETEDDMWSVDYSKLVPMLIKEIQDLKAEVAALKGA